MTPALLNWFSGNAGFILTRICANEKAAEAFKKLKLQNVRTRCYFDFLDARKHTMIKREDLNYFSYVSIVTSQSLQKRLWQLSSHWWHSKKSKSQARLVPGLQKISSSKKMEMDGLSQSSQPFLFGLLQKGCSHCICCCADSKIHDATDCIFCQGNEMSSQTVTSQSFHFKHQKAVLAGEVDNYSSGTSNESPISLRPEMVKEWRDGGSSCGNKRKKKGEEAMIAGNPTSNKSNASKNGSSGHSTPLDYFPFYLRLSHGDAFNTQNANFSNSDNRECFSHSKPKIKAMFIASGSLSFSARPLFPSLGDLRKSLKPKGATKTIDNKKNKQDDSQLCSPNQMKPIGPFPEAILLKEFCEGEERQDMEIHMIGACEDQKCSTVTTSLMNFELEARWINDFKSMFRQRLKESSGTALVIKDGMKQSQRIAHLPNLSSKLCKEGMIYDDDDDEANMMRIGRLRRRRRPVLTMMKPEGRLLFLCTVTKKMTMENNEVRHSKFASAIYTKEKSGYLRKVAASLFT
ncbi:hypothetical protein NC652_012394 [Populus alba x Populus x berolinensis]|nr:hypothetical protein NC652_012394 [Populus alba x Populus x berolinensis]